MPPYRRRSRSRPERRQLARPRPPAWPHASPGHCAHVLDTPTSWPRLCRRVLAPPLTTRWPCPPGASNRFASPVLRRALVFRRLEHTSQTERVGARRAKRQSLDAGTGGGRGELRGLVELGRI